MVYKKININEQPLVYFVRLLLILIFPYNDIALVGHINYNSKCKFI